ncbi:MAG: NAD-dependent epimerase/dehydratase family protein [Cytophagales bacterium]|nr:NAD-dependent epimerase/dehydratase family protein [Cytophagales bacterium]
MIQIVGGSGFIGTRLMEILTHSEFGNFDLKNSLKFPQITRIGDINIKESIRFSEECDIVVLLAAEHRDDVFPASLYYDVNVQGTKNVLERMDEYGIKNLIFTSTVAIYGLNKDNPDEEHIHDPFNDYGKSKLMAENLIKEWFEKSPKGKSVTIIRPTVVFGENNRGNVYNLIKQLSDRKFIMIGNGNNKKSLAYVGNVAAFIKHRVETVVPGFDIFNYADSPDYSMQVLVKKLSDYLQVNHVKLSIPYIVGLLFGLVFDLLAFILRRKLHISYVRVKKFCANTRYNATKAHNEFNAPFSLDEGFERTINNDFLLTK